MENETKTFHIPFFTATEKSKMENECLFSIFHFPSAVENEINGMYTDPGAYLIVIQLAYHEHMHIVIHLVEVCVCGCVCLCVLRRPEKNLGRVRTSRSQVNVKVIFRRVQGHSVRLCRG